ncbi:MAG: glutathione peroxidase [Burkholderiales bacterium]|nr:glutathione peroxidase [Burkholderiales bacterium]
MWLRAFALASCALGFTPIVPAAPAVHGMVANATCPVILQKTFPRLQDETPQNLCQYAGKVVMVVNTASYCGFTRQYEGLEKLYARHVSQGLVVLGFPSNDFGQQEPGDSKQIADFCFNTYGVKFPMFGKSVVQGSHANALYRELIQATGQEPRWNFHKYLIDRKGKVLASYPSETAPEDPRLVADIKRALAVP